MGPPPPPAQRPEETRFLRLLEELRVRLGGNFRRSEEAGFSRPAAVTALRAMVGNNTQSDVNRVTGFRVQPSLLGAGRATSTGSATRASATTATLRLQPRPVLPQR
eukprot:SAG31_NODE_17958_length_641_cov_7.773551_2_plen_105_part_01